MGTRGLWPVTTGSLCPCVCPCTPVPSVQSASSLLVPGHRTFLGCGLLCGGDPNTVWLVPAEGRLAVRLPTLRETAFKSGRRAAGSALPLTWRGGVNVSESHVSISSDQLLKDVVLRRPRWLSKCLPATNPVCGTHMVEEETRILKFSLDMHLYFGRCVCLLPTFLLWKICWNPVPSCTSSSQREG